MPAHQIIAIVAVASIPVLVPLLVALLIKVTPDHQRFWATPANPTPRETQ